MDIHQSLAALSNPVRRQILAWLKDRSNFPPPLQEHREVEGVCVGYIQEKTRLAQPTISNHMGKLKQAGLVRSKRHGQWTFYRRDEEAIRDFIDALAEELDTP